MQNQISSGLIEKADQLMQYDKWKNGLTTSKIRNILSKVQDLYHDVRTSAEDMLTPDHVGQIQYIKIRLIYECGREYIMKDFVTATGILRLLNEIGTNKAKYMELCHYLEALVAYHRFYGGKDGDK